MHKISKSLAPLAGIALLFAAVGCQSTPAASQKVAAFRDWPAGAAPNEVGERVAKNFVVRKLDFETNPRREYVIYPEVCGWYGSLTVANLASDKSLQKKLIRKF